MSLELTRSQLLDSHFSIVFICRTIEATIVSEKLWQIYRWVFEDQGMILRNLLLFQPLICLLVPLKDVLNEILLLVRPSQTHLSCRVLETNRYPGAFELLIQSQLSYVLLHCWRRDFCLVLHDGLQAFLSRLYLSFFGTTPPETRKMSPIWIEVFDKLFGHFGLPCHRLQALTTF